MATTIKRQIGTATRYVIKFDSPPSMNELRKALGDIDVAERGAPLSLVSNEAGAKTASPVRFVFVTEGESETDVPVS